MAQTHSVVNDRITPQSEGVSPSAPRDLNLLASPWPALVLGVIATTAAALLINAGALENNPGWISSLSGFGILAVCRGAWSLGRSSSQAASRRRLSVELAARSEAHFLTDNGGAVLFDNGITCQAAYLAKTEADVVFFTSFLFAARLYYS